MGEILTLEHDPEKVGMGFRARPCSTKSHSDPACSAESGLISAVYETIFKPGVKAAAVFQLGFEAQALFAAFGLAVLVGAQDAVLQHIR
jgi:predicted Fe-Mo cluster-binding NifX family protein